MTAMNTPRNATLKSGTTVVGAGYLLTNDGTNNKLDLTAAGEVALGVSMDESERDASGLVSGGTVGYTPMGGVLMIASAASQTYTTGLTVYAGAGGLLTTTAGSNKKVGLYIGEGKTTSSSAGDLVPVMTGASIIA